MDNQNFSGVCNFWETMDIMQQKEHVDFGRFIHSKNGREKKREIEKKSGHCVGFCSPVEKHTRS